MLSDVQFHFLTPTDNNSSEYPSAPGCKFFQRAGLDSAAPLRHRCDVMYPVLFRFGALEIHTYGVLVAAGFLFGILTAQRRARQVSLNAEHIGDLGVWLIVSAMLGAKLFHIIFFWDDFIAGWRATGLMSLRAGFVFYGGFLGATIGVVTYARLEKLPIGTLADAFAPSIALGHAFGRLGCFFEGCCYGRACALPWAVALPGHTHALHPTQLYEAAGNLVIFAGLSVLYRRRKFTGQIWWLYVLSYGVLRFGVEFFRGDYEVHYFGIFTITQVIAGVMVAASALVLCGKTGAPPVNSAHHATH